MTDIQASSSSSSSSSSASAPRSARLMGLDLLRLASFSAIIPYHYGWMVWNAVDGNIHTNVWIFSITFARALAFSGFTVLFLSSLLLALKTPLERSFKKFYALLLVAWTVFNILGRDENPFFWTWEIYPLIIVGLLSSRWAEKFLKQSASLILFVVGFSILWIPFWAFEGKFGLSLELEHILIGNCAIDVAEWPTLPWIGLIWSGYGIGLFLRQKQWITKSISPRLHINSSELWVWLSLLILSVFHGLGGYFHTPLGQWFTCFALRQTPTVFWSNFVWVFFAIRLSLDSRVQAAIEKSRLLVWISNLAMSRRFGLAYFIQYMVGMTWAGAIHTFEWNSDFVGDFSLLTIWPLTEYLTRLTERGLKSSKK